MPGSLSGGWPHENLLRRELFSSSRRGNSTVRYLAILGTKCLATSFPRMVMCSASACVLALPRITAWPDRFLEPFSPHIAIETGGGRL